MFRLGWVRDGLRWPSAGQAPLRARRATRAAAPGTRSPEPAERVVFLRRRVHNLAAPAKDPPDVQSDGIRP